MKREVSKRVIKKRILALSGVFATLLLCVGIAVAMFTKVDAATKLPESVVVGLNEYTKEKPLEVLEIVPYLAYDELGPITGDDQGTFKWTEIVAAAPTGASKAEDMSTYLQTVLNKYGTFLNDMVKGDYKMCFKDIRTGKIYSQIWEATPDKIGYDYKNVKPVLCTLENGVYYEKAFDPVDADAQWADLVAAAPSGQANTTAIQSYLSGTIAPYVNSARGLFSDSCKVYYKCVNPAGESETVQYFEYDYNFSWQPQVFNYDFNNVSMVLCEKVTAEDGTVSYFDIPDGFKYLSAWDKIAQEAPSGEDNAEALVEYINTTVNRYCKTYLQAINSSYVICFTDKDNKRYENTGEFTVDLSAIDYDLKKLTPVFCYRYEGDHYETLDDSLDIRNYFALMIFGDFDMEDKIKIIPKVASEVTIADIDNAGLIYICGNSHNATLVNYYNTVNGTSVPTSGNQWLLGGMDLSAEVAVHLQMKSVVDRKAVIIGSTDKGSDANGNYSNIARFGLLQCGIDADVFISDFAYDTITENREYEGLYGKFKIGTERVNGKSVEAMKVYLDVKTYYNDIGRTLTGTVGSLEELPFGSTMFINDTATSNGHGYAPNGNNVDLYPAYNATGSRKQDFLTKSTFVFNSDNSLTNSFGNDEAWQSDYDEYGNYLGSAYGDALFKLEILYEEDLRTPGVIEYILGAYGGGDVIVDLDDDGDVDIRVLEIEPSGAYRYFDTSYSDKELICKWFGLYTGNLLIVDESTKNISDDSKLKVDITIDHMSMNAFNGYNGEIRSEYDLIILGAYDLVTKNNAIVQNIINVNSDSRYNRESSGATDDQIYNNDLTDKAYNKLMDYLKADMPLVLDRDIYNRRVDAAAKDTNVYKVNSIELTKAFGSAANVIPVNLETPSADQAVSRTVKYIVKPSVTVAPQGAANYDWDTFTGDMLVTKNALKSMKFTGTVMNSSEFRMKIYVDRDCDSIYNEDYSTDDSELVYFAADELGNPITDINDEILGGLCASELLSVKKDENGKEVLDADGNKVWVVGEGPNVSPVKLESFVKTTDKDGNIVWNIGDKVKYTSIKDDDGKICGWNVEVVLGLPEALNGYMAWKVEIIDDITGRVNVNTGAFAVQNPVRKEVKVIQIVNPATATTAQSNIDLKGEAFQNAFSATTAVTNLDLVVDVYTKPEFNNVKDKKALLDDYSMLVLGLSDNYGVTNGYDFDSDSLAAIKYYIDNGNSVLFTHDSLSYKNDAGSAAGSYAGLNAFTKTFQTAIGMQSGYVLTDPLHMKLADGKSGRPANYSLFSNVNATTNTRTTDKVTRLNKGEITEYPYTIKGTGSNGTITVAQTHAQYFKLNLEDLKNEDGTDADDVVVWYTLDRTDTVTYTDAYGNPTAKSDSELSKFFAATGQDAINNYYVYSMGNITYSSAGHSVIGDGQTEELQLFVNTFVRAILSGNSRPEVSYENAAQDSENVYSQFYRGQYYSESGEIPGPDEYDYINLNTEFTYKITDPDLAIGAGRITEAWMFYDANNNDVYDEGTDVRLCYIGYDGTKPVYSVERVYDPTDRDSRSVISGTGYKVNLWQILENAEVPDDIQHAMAKKLVNNQLRIGIMAIDSRNAKGYGILKFVQRDLHKLE